MKALVLEKKGVLKIRDIQIEEPLGPKDVRIELKACGICGSDLHYYKEGGIGDFIVREPMVLGHEASGVVIETGSEVTHLKKGDRVCMEPGVPDFMSHESLAGYYNLDKSVRFWATPPVHGVMRESVVHPASLTFPLADGVSFHEGAMVEPLAVGIESAKQAEIKPGDVALVIGAGTIGIVTALSALAGGCSKVIVSDIVDEKLAFASSYDGLVSVHAQKQNLKEAVLAETQGKGVDVLFEASGSAAVYPSMFALCRPAARAVLIGMVNGHVPFDITLLQVLGITMKTIFRYRNCFDRALSLISSGKVELTKLVSKVFSFDNSIEAYDFAAAGRADVVKVMIDF